MQIFESYKEFVKLYGMKSKSQFHQVLRFFTIEVGVPNDFILDPSGEQTSAVVHDLFHKIGTTLCILEERT